MYDVQSSACWCVLLIMYLVTSQTHSQSLWVCLQSPPCFPRQHSHHLLYSYPTHLSPPLLLVLSGAVNENDWTDTIGRRRAWWGALCQLVFVAETHQGKPLLYLQTSWPPLLYSLFFLLKITESLVFVKCAWPPNSPTMFLCTGMR